MGIDVSVNKLFYEEATVIVWRNVTKLKFIPTGHFGHAAIMLRGQSLALGNGKYKYISWWPPEAGKEDAFRQQDGIAESNYHQDMVDEISERARTRLGNKEIQPRPHQLDITGDMGFGAASNAQVSIPGIGSPQDPQHAFGLCLKRMWSWWEWYQVNNGKYQLASKKTKLCRRCSGCLIRRWREWFFEAAFYHNLCGAKAG